MRFIFLFVLFLINSTLFAQFGNIRGFVYDKSSKEPIMFCNVILKGTTTWSGRFICSKIKDRFAKFMKKKD